MSRYIDADALKELYKPFQSYNGKELAVPIGAILANIDDAPSIDIVRCQECKYKRINEDGETRYYYCALEDRPNRQWSVDDTDYCSWAEREGE